MSPGREVEVEVHVLTDNIKDKVNLYSEKMMLSLAKRRQQLIDSGRSRICDVKSSFCHVNPKNAKRDLMFNTSIITIHKAVNFDPRTKEFIPLLEDIHYDSYTGFQCVIRKDNDTKVNIENTFNFVTAYCNKCGNIRGSVRNRDVMSNGMRMQGRCTILF